MELTEIKPATFWLENRIDGKAVLVFGPSPFRLEIGDVLEIQQSPTDMYRLGQLLTESALGQSGACAQLEDDLDETAYPVPQA